MSQKIDYLYDQYQKLTPEQRQEFDDKQLGLQTDTALAAKEEFKIVSALDYYDEVEEAYKNWGRMCGLGTGYPDIDRLTMGLERGELTVIGGQTSHGKTALGINIAANIALRKHTVLFITLEMTKRQVGMRFKHLYKHDSEAYVDMLASLTYQEKDELKWTSIDGLMRQAVQEAGVELVVIDHLHYFTRELDHVAEDLGRITKEFKKNAIRHDVPVILISHTRKKEGKGKVDINDLRGSSYIAQDADIVLMVSRERRAPEYITVALEKNRNRHGSDVGTDVLLNFAETRITSRGLALL